MDTQFSVKQYVVALQKTPLIVLKKMTNLAVIMKATRREFSADCKTKNE
ncbi:MAG TPA: hypothetical protein PLE90_08125 [Dysgonamonadaceae bacterium]|nr:hypothetical protein [Dysgonamonadaceae bacterium]